MDDIFLPDTVILETEWVLRYADDLTPVEVCGALRKVFGLRNLHLTKGH